MPQATPSARKTSALYSSSPSGVLTAPFTGDLFYVHGPNTLTHTHIHTPSSPSGCLLPGVVSSPPTYGTLLTSQDGFPRKPLTFHPSLFLPRGPHSTWTKAYTKMQAVAWSPTAKSSKQPPYASQRTGSQMRHLLQPFNRKAFENYC